MARYDIPERVVSDNGPQYTPSEFQDFANKYEFEHVTSSPRYPESNGKAESAVKTAKRIMEKALDAKSDPYLAILEYRNTPSDGMSTSPAQRLLGRRTRTTQFQCRVNCSSLRVPAPQSKSYNKPKLNKLIITTKDQRLPALAVGDSVRMMPEKGKRPWRKGKVKAIVGPRSYLVSTDDGGNYRRNRRHLRKTMEQDDVEADVALPTKDQDLTDLHLPQAACEESVPHQPKDQATPKVAVRTSSRQTRRPAYLEDYVTET